MLLRMALFFLNYPVRISQKSCRATIIGAKVRALRLEKKWSQHDLATKVQLLGCECSDLTILRIEKGDRFVPDYEVKALAKVFNVSYESLLDD